MEEDFEEKAEEEIMQFRRRVQNGELVNFRELINSQEVRGVPSGISSVEIYSAKGSVMIKTTIFGGPKIT